MRDEFLVLYGHDIGSLILFIALHYGLSQDEKRETVTLNSDHDFHVSFPLKRDLFNHMKKTVYALGP